MLKSRLSTCKTITLKDMTIPPSTLTTLIILVNSSENVIPQPPFNNSNPQQVNNLISSQHQPHPRLPQHLLQLDRVVWLVTAILTQSHSLEPYHKSAKIPNICHKTMQLVSWIISSNNKMNSFLINSLPSDLGLSNRLTTISYNSV